MVGVICYQDKNEERTLTFQEILLDETVLEGQIFVRRSALREVGGFNTRLPGSRNLEVILRIVQRYEVVRSSRKPDYYVEDLETVEVEHSRNTDDEWMELPSEEDVPEAKWVTDCYLISRYKKVFLELGVFNDAVAGLLDMASARSDYLENMIAEKEQYQYFYQGSQPILIYCGDYTCNSVLDFFARQFGTELEKKGKLVEYFDLSEHDVTDLDRLYGRSFQAIVGFQCYIFSAEAENGTNFHDYIHGPKYNFLFDHPIKFQHQLQNVPKDYCMLTCDRNYASFLKKYENIDAMFLPPAGTLQAIEPHVHIKSEKDDSEDGRKKYDISFLGKCSNGFSGRLQMMLNQDRQTRRLWYRYLRLMQQRLDQPPEVLFMEALSKDGRELTTDEFMKMFHEIRWMITAMSGRYRLKVVKTLLEAGLTVHVFGADWRESKLSRYQNLICHDSVLAEDGMQVYAQSKITLNVMTWHKDGFTERIANAMLQNAVVVTDETKYLREHFKDDEELILFQLDQMEELPIRIKRILGNPEQLKQIAGRGKERALREHTWKNRVECFLQINEKNQQ